MEVLPQLGTSLTAAGRGAAVPLAFVSSLKERLIPKARSLILDSIGMALAIELPHPLS